MALEALKGELTLAQLAARHGVHQTMISTWRKQAMDGMASVFSGKAEAAEASREADVEKLHAKDRPARGGTRFFWRKPSVDEP